MQFLFPCDYFDKKKPDEMYQAEFEAFKAAGVPVSTIDVDNISKSNINPALSEGEKVVYRGWMLNEPNYRALVSRIRGSKAEPLTDTITYLSAHHLPNWYPLLKEFTPETVVFPPNADLESELKSLGWDAFFVKDNVKSLKTSIGSIIQKPEDIRTVITEMEKYRGEIEGNLCIRQVEDFIPESEQRYFVVLGRAFASEPSKTLPTIVLKCAEIVNSPFFSIDIIRRSDGVQRIVEIGDGQVSDIVGWSPKRFVEIWQEAS